MVISTPRESGVSEGGKVFCCFRTLKKGVPSRRRYCLLWSFHITRSGQQEVGVAVGKRTRLQVHAQVRRNLISSLYDGSESGDGGGIRLRLVVACYSTVNDGAMSLLLSFGPGRGADGLWLKHIGDVGRRRTLTRWHIKSS